jgi:hypothetical protein
LHNLNIQFSVIGITETWLQNASHLVDINGFSFFHKHRLNRVGVARMLICIYPKIMIRESVVICVLQEND